MATSIATPPPRQAREGGAKGFTRTAARLPRDQLPGESLVHMTAYSTVSARHGDRGAPTTRGNNTVRRCDEARVVRAVGPRSGDVSGRQGTAARSRLGERGDRPEGRLGAVALDTPERHPRTTPPKPVAPAFRPAGTSRRPPPGLLRRAPRLSLPAARRLRSVTTTLSAHKVVEQVPPKIDYAGIGRMGCTEGPGASTMLVTGADRGRREGRPEPAAHRRRLMVAQ
jgi:hypothetical protein